MPLCSVKADTGGQKVKYLVGIDIGTTGTKSVLFDTNGHEIASAYAEYPMYQPQNGWAEQDPEDWWEAVKKTLCEITSSLPSEIRDGIVGIGLSGQMHSLVLLDENNDVIRRAILWCDQRTAKECEQIESIIGREKLIEITANPALTGFTASKIMWVKNHEPHNFEKCRHILLAKDYIRFKLTGEYATEVSDASGMQLLDVKRRCWSYEVCEALGIDTKLLAKVYESCEATGRVTAEAYALTGINEGVTVAGGGGDNAASAIGMGVCGNGKAFTTVGTSGVVFAHTNEPIVDKEGRIHTFCAAVPGTWHVMGVTQAAGLSLNWFRRELSGGASYQDIDEECSKIGIGADGLIFLPYLMGERTPILDPNARGVFFGLSAMHTKFHLARSVIEGVTYSLRDCLCVINEVGIAVDDMSICGGGAKSRFWKQMIADVFGMPISTAECTEGAVLGAAILGGVASGVYPSVEKGCEAAVRKATTLEPNNSDNEAYLRTYKLYTELYPALKKEFERLRKI